MQGDNAKGKQKSPALTATNSLESWIIPKNETRLKLFARSPRSRSLRIWTPFAYLIRLIEFLGEKCSRQRAEILNRQNVINSRACEWTVSFFAELKKVLFTLDDDCLRLLRIYRLILVSLANNLGIDADRSAREAESSLKCNYLPLSYAKVELIKL